MGAVLKPAIGVGKLKRVRNDVSPNSIEKLYKRK